MQKALFQSNENILLNKWRYYQVDNLKDIEQYLNSIFFFSLSCICRCQLVCQITQNISFQDGFYSFIDPFIILINSNYSNIVVGQITSSNAYIIISQIGIKIQVQNMKIVNTRLILNYYCQQNQFICFYAWNIANLSSPFFEKNLRSIQNSNNIQLFAYNLFYYVQTNKQISVYNPVILEHSSLFYTFNYNEPYFTTTSQVMALISFNSQFYLLNPLLVYSYQITLQNTITNEIAFWSNTFNFTVQSQIGTKGAENLISNQQFMILNDSLDIYN
ncbi:unnamed protein product [Paramecium octaurelia]|uniref:Uncharacterized protein n=1 Tax=Paramecium octaurelia TaxID=43137 RepID=A0A8S1ULR0_PAROT|nr:unnamed protein product [Paramecium octaurelia]